MISKKIPLNIDYKALGYDNGGSSPTLSTYLWEESQEMPWMNKRPAVLVCPGGGYTCVSQREGEPIALKYCSEGFQTFLLHYTVMPGKFPCALLEAAKAIAMIREHAEEWRVDPEKIFVCGFSAGGHLAGSTGVFWDSELVKNALGVTGEQLRPTGMILSYAVLSAFTPHLQFSFPNLMGGDSQNPEDYRNVSLDTLVNPDTPPAFLWHTVDDDVVDVENTMNFASALRKNGIQFEMHLYPHGPHGMSLANEITPPVLTDCQNWITMSVRWIKSFL